MAKSKKMPENKCCEDVSKGEPSSLLVGLKTGRGTAKIRVGDYPNTEHKHGLTHDPGIPLLGVCP